MTREALLHWAAGIAVALALWFAGLLIAKFLANRLARLVRKTPTEVDDLFFAAFRAQIPVWSGILGVVLGAQLALPGAARPTTLRLGEAAFILSFTIASARLVGELVARQSARWPDTVPATTLTQNLARIVVVALGLLVTAGTLGIAITPLVTALGVGSLAVALALQPTLTNLFAGFHVTLARQIRVGDYVELEGGGQGFVQDIGWRSTQIRELSNNLIIVPNAKIADIIVKNYSLPQADQAALVQVGVAYGSDLAEVERVTVEVAREVQRTVRGADAFEPFIRFHTFGESSIDFTVILRVKEFVDRYLVVHEFMKRLHCRYRESGIEIPFPQRVVHAPSRNFRNLEIRPTDAEEVNRK